MILYSMALEERRLDGDDDEKATPGTHRCGIAFAQLLVGCDR
jgi:hypothetical protein